MKSRSVCTINGLDADIRIGLDIHINNYKKDLVGMGDRAQCFFLH